MRVLDGDGDEAEGADKEAEGDGDERPVSSLTTTSRSLVTGVEVSKLAEFEYGPK